MALSPRPTFCQIAFGEHYQRRSRRAVAVAARKLTASEARTDAAAWDNVLPWTDALDQIAGPWPAPPAAAPDSVRAAARTVAAAAEAALRRAEASPDAAGREGRSPDDLAALAAALRALVQIVVDSPAATAPGTGGAGVRNRHLIPADPCAADQGNTA